MIRLVKQMKSDRQDINGVKIIKDEQDNIMVKRPQITNG